MKNNFLYKKENDGENKKAFLLGLPFSHKEKTALGYIDHRLFGLWKSEKKNGTTKYYICGLCVRKKSAKQNVATDNQTNDATDNQTNDTTDNQTNVATDNQTNDTTDNQTNVATDNQTNENEYLKYQIEVLKEKFEQIMIQSRQQLISLLLMNSNDSNLYYIQGWSYLFIFTKKIFSYDNTFIFDFFSQKLSTKELYVTFKIMPAECALYKEVSEEFKQGNVLLHKYNRRLGGMVAKNIITYDSQNSDLYLETSYLGVENCQLGNGKSVLNTSRRKIVTGITVSDYLKDKTDLEQKSILKAFFDWIFETYQHPADKDKLDGKLVDCNLGNFLILNGKFIPIDYEFYIESGVSKDICLWYALGRRDYFSPHYEYFAELYGLRKIAPDFVYPFWEEEKEILEKAAVLNQDLIDKYFTGKYLSPIYD